LPVSASVFILFVAVLSSQALSDEGKMKIKGGASFLYPGVNCIFESFPEDGFWSTGDYNPAEYEGTAIENQISLSPSGAGVNSEVEVFCPIPYMVSFFAEEFGADGNVDLKGNDEDEIMYYEVQAFVDDNNGKLFCMVLATNAAEPEGGSYLFDWESSDVLFSFYERQNVLRWLMLDTSLEHEHSFLTLHCQLEPCPDPSNPTTQQIIGYGLKKAKRKQAQ